MSTLKTNVIENVTGSTSIPVDQIAVKGDIPVIPLPLPVGAVIPMAGNTAPEEYFRCNGAAVSRSTYSVLFGVIGTVYGAGDGSTTFNLPDLRGEFVRGFDDGRGIDTGRLFGSFQDHTIQQHTHASAAAAAGNQILSPGTNGAALSGDSTGNINSGNSSNETRPRNIAMTYVIKYK